MELFRISLDKFAGTLTSSRSANRWNIDGQSVIYTGSSRSLSTLKLTVHRNTIVPTHNYKVMVISVADEDNLFSQVQTKDLAPNWRTLAGYAALQAIGSAWYARQQSLVLKVPSAVIIQEYNYIINLTHPEFTKKVTLVRTEDYFWDERLLDKGKVKLD